jgi:multiple sugar transport system permease protein
MWSWILNGTSGIFNRMLLKTGIITKNIEWLSTPGLTLGVLIFIDIWTFTPFVALVLYAGLQGIPTQLYEAATIDGAGTMRKLVHITMPMLKSSASVAFLMRSMMALRTFDSIWIITRGGPAGSTEILGTYAYKKGMVGFNIGMGSASSAIIFLLSLLLSIWFVGAVLKKNR